VRDHVNTSETIDPLIDILCRFRLWKSIPRSPGGGTAGARSGGGPSEASMRVRLSRSGGLRLLDILGRLCSETTGTFFFGDTTKRVHPDLERLTRPDTGRETFANRETSPDKISPAAPDRLELKKVAELVQEFRPPPLNESLDDSA